MVAALGIVFGDIGTSPLYSLETAVAVSGLPPATVAVGVASLVIWVLLLVVTLKYVQLVMRADYHGEGGIFALLALLRETLRKRGRTRIPLAGLLIFGAALLFGDGAITPAISVLSAVEGIGAVEPRLEPAVMPITVVILGTLFALQSFGTGALGSRFGLVMLVWFISIAALGMGQIVHAPAVLQAFNPFHAIELFLRAPAVALPILGAVVLAVTGAEALYADMGHFGKRAIVRAWHFIVLPCLVLNYLGQAAYLLRTGAPQVDPNLFFLLAPEGAPRMLLLGLATAATIIASQALISGVFSLAAQAIDLKYLPRLEVRHTSPTEPGQVYMPAVSLLLGATTLMLVFIFKNSQALAAAYGLAVTGAMAITSLAFCMVMRISWERPFWQTGLVLAGLFCLDLPLFAACLTKFFEGGFVPVVIALAVGVIMFSWRKGFLNSYERIAKDAPSMEGLSQWMSSPDVRRVPGCSVSVWRDENEVFPIAATLERYRRTFVLPERMILLFLVADWRHATAEAHSVQVREYAGGLWVVRARHGYMRDPNVPRVMERAQEFSKGRLAYDPEHTIFFLPHVLALEHSGTKMTPLGRSIFAFLAKVVLPAADYLHIPAERLVIFNWVLRL